MASGASEWPKTGAMTCDIRSVGNDPAVGLECDLWWGKTGTQAPEGNNKNLTNSDNRPTTLTSEKERGGNDNNKSKRKQINRKCQN